MKMMVWRPRLLVLLLILSLAACGSNPPEPSAAEVTNQPAPEASTEEGVEEPEAPPTEATLTEAPVEEERSSGPEPEAARTETEAVDGESAVTLRAIKTMTEHSKAAANRTAAASALEPPPEDSWQQLRPNESTVFESYDGVRVREEGEAWLDLGDLMHLILKRDSEVQSMSGEDVRSNLANLEVEIDAPLLQRLVLGLHLSRGGVTGEKLKQNDTIALTTPNSVIIVSGTQFLLTYDPGEETTTAGNFNGTVDVASPELEEKKEELDQGEIITIPPVRGEMFWPIHDHMDFEEYQRLIDLLESPIAAVDMISGPYLVILTAPGIDVRGGPGMDFPRVGWMAEGDYARILAVGEAWLQIECTEDMAGPECWVAAEDVAAYNGEFADKAPTATPTATPTFVAMCRVNADSIALWEGPGGQREDGGLIYNRLGYEYRDTELPVGGKSNVGEWLQVASSDVGDEGWAFAPSCPLVMAVPIPTISEYGPTVTFTPSPTLAPGETPEATVTATSTPVSPTPAVPYTPSPTSVVVKTEVPTLTPPPINTWTPSPSQTPASTFTPIPTATNPPPPPTATSTPVTPYP